MEFSLQHTNSHEHHAMVVAAKDVVATDVVSLTLAATNPTRAPGDTADGHSADGNATGGATRVPEWDPGSHIDLILGADLIRQYSLCGSVADGDHLRIAVLREPSGRGGSERVHDVLAVGDTVEIKGPRNHFPLVDAASYLFVAGGIGITPLIPMIAQVDDAGAEWSLLYGGRTRSGMAFADDLVEKYGDRVTVRPEDEYGLLPLADALDDQRVGTTVYCCGPEPLLTAIEKLCDTRPDVELHVERFAPKAQTVDGTDGASFEVELAQSGREIRVGEGETVLDALLREGIDHDFSCREGTCGTCETAVLDGVPDHRDSVLSDEEKAENDCMMVCVSRSCSPRLVLDL
ncbi:PDR/VanB family oxidoreductase [Gordonia polyisoprenivorans]|uniref:PDR/VanB family oxidoreductase n=1 Tax=Gordonia polyisoprenivorans TaxID=84595 RepID=UPI000B99D719|nr:PDR/VanB family oxidoreductase [Gordonia polyisoprenivorans]OZC29622.1 oxidoreductase [Gordonia polyisoprenivorans]